MIWLMLKPNNLHTNPIKYHIYEQTVDNQQIALCGRRNNMQVVKPPYIPLEQEVCKSCIGALNWEL